MTLHTAHDFHQAFSRGERSAVQLLDLVLQRVQARDPAVTAFLHIDEAGARQAAAALDARRAQGRALGALAGVPVAVKDNICTRSVLTTAGSKMLANFRPPYDATVIERLRKADALIVGKTNLDEFAMGSSCENSAFFPSRNPWDLHRVPGGSSGGSAAAVAAGMVPLALGSDTGGSIRQPAALCGLTGVKPSYGLVSRFGLIAFASSFDQIGPLGSSARECAWLLEAIAGPDPRDATSLTAGFVREAPPDSLRGVRLGYPQEFREVLVEPAVQSRVNKAVSALEELGAELVPIRLPSVDTSLAAYLVLATAEASSNLARYDGVHYGLRAHGCADLESLTARSRALGFGAEVRRRICLGTFALSSGYYEAYYRKANAVRGRIQADFRRAFGRVDAIVGPTSPIPAFPLGERSSDPLTMYAVDVFTLAANLAGLPALSLPCGLTRDGLPVGLQLMGPKLSDARLLAIAECFQAASDHHRALAPMRGEG